MTAPSIDQVTATAFRIPTDAPESDGTLEWDQTTLVLVEARADGVTGLGYSYAAPEAATLAAGPLADAVTGLSAFDIPRAFRVMRAEVRNLGRPGVVACALSAVDVALWDLKARLLDLPLADLLGRCQPSVMAYGSGGFTSYSDRQLQDQLGGWAAEGLTAVKMKLGREPARDPARLRLAREAIGADCALFVDANGAWTVKQALAQAAVCAEQGVTWLEEPVSSDDLAGLAQVRAQGPAGVEVAAGEYGWSLDHFRRLLAAEAVDVLQADASRCGGITGFLAAAALARAHHRPLSSHCAPALHLAVCAASEAVVHMEWFHDHVRIERMLFDGAPEICAGRLIPSDRPGLGLRFRAEAAARFRL